jgi:hypothetical protein
MKRKQSIKLPTYILICILLVQYHCKSDEIKLQDNILVVPYELAGSRQIAVFTRMLILFLPSVARVTNVC